MKVVRTSIDWRAREAAAPTGKGRIPEMRSSRRQDCEGGDRLDPRLFYFRALLQSDRFFGGGGRI